MKMCPNYSMEEVDTVLKHMGWSSLSDNYYGVKRTVAYALHYARVNELNNTDDPLNIMPTYNIYNTPEKF